MTQNFQTHRLASSQKTVISMLHRCSVFFTLTVFCSTVLAQYAWIDEKGNKQFSDQPPPASIPKNKILKYPGRAINSSATDDNTSAEKPKAKPPETLADKVMASNKQRDDLAAKTKKEEEASKAASAKADNCNRMREYQQSLNSGERISRMDSNGQKSYLSDQDRAKESAFVNQNLSDCN